MCGLVTQGSGIWRVRNAIQWRAVLPFILGSALGVPAGTALLKFADQGTIRFSIGALLVVFSLCSLFRPALKPVQGGVPRELGVGIANGLIGGLTGLGGIAVTIWCQLQAGPKDAQRAIFQPVMFSTFAMSADLARRGRRVQHRNAEALRARLARSRAGIWAGIKLYGKLDDAAFRKIVLILLLMSGLSLIVPNALN